MGFLIIKNLVSHCYSNADGEIIYNYIMGEFAAGNRVVVSFEGVDSVSSSFVNSAFIDLLKNYDFDHLKRHLSFVNSNKSINEMIKRRFNFEVNQRRKLIEV